MAEQLFLHEAGSGFQARSAGVCARPGQESPPEAVAALEKYGIDGTGHRSRDLSAADVDWADVILVMSKAHQTDVVLKYPRAVGKTRVLKTYVELPGDPHIPDPIGQTQEVYDYCAGIIHSCITELLKKIKPEESQ